jgi:ABC-type Fe3+-siderophore transport system permease subunit
MELIMFVLVVCILLLLVWGTWTRLIAPNKALVAKIVVGVIAIPVSIWLIGCLRIEIEDTIQGWRDR